MEFYICTVEPLYNTIVFHQNTHKKTSHSSPVRARYGVSFVSSKPDPYPTPVDVVVYFISAIMNHVIKRFYCNLQNNFSNWWLMWICLEINVTGPHWCWINIGSGNGLLLSGSILKCLNILILWPIKKMIPKDAFNDLIPGRKFLFWFL